MARKTYAVGERTLTEIIHDLSQPIPGELLKTKPAGNIEITYIPWHQATRLLDLYAPGWSFKIERIEHIKDLVVMTVSLSIVTSEGVITRYATGNENDVTSGYGDPFSNAESMALRRAAAKFGLGRYLYNK